MKHDPAIGGLISVIKELSLPIAAFNFGPFLDDEHTEILAYYIATAGPKKLATPTLPDAERGGGR